ncbi:MAG: FadR/GntR family transcriptional regulator [Syntrophomonadaceae bacterium]|jgi:GntR family transcriptional repressor for pyruvate dehydrogenase complex
MDRFGQISQQKKYGRTKSARIANYLEDLILSKQLTAGQLLPSQQELAETFGASSRSIREAFKQLEAKGLLSVSQGRRATVKSNNLDQFVESMTDSILRNGSNDTKLMLDLVQVLTSVEVSAARDFSRNTKRKEVVKELYAVANKMEEALKGLEQKEVGSLEKFRRSEGDFHRLLVRSNGNIILDAIYENLSPLLEESLAFSKLTCEECEKKVREYYYIAEALEYGQTDLAVALVLVCLTDLKQRISEQVEKTSSASFA